MCVCVKMADEITNDKRKVMHIMKYIPNNKDIMMTSGRAIALKKRKFGIAVNEGGLRAPAQCSAVEEGNRVFEIPKKRRKRKTSLRDSAPQLGPRAPESKRSRNRNGQGKARGSKGDQRHGTTSVSGEMSLRCGTVKLRRNRIRMSVSSWSTESEIASLFLTSDAMQLWGSRFTVSKGNAFLPNT